VPWVAAGAASVAVLAQLEWPSAARAMAWGLALAMVPLTYSVALWPDRALGFLALWASPLLGEPREEPDPGATAEIRRHG
jgi:xanthine/uracil/vitamin C permease (AzgA family)